MVAWHFIICGLAFTLCCNELCYFVSCLWLCGCVRTSCAHGILAIAHMIQRCIVIYATYLLPRIKLFAAMRVATFNDPGCDPDFAS